MEGFLERFERADEVRLWRYVLPLVEPVTLGPGKTISERSGVILEVVRDGKPFFGEAAPLPGFSRETLAEVEEQLRHIIVAYPGLELSQTSAFRGNFLPSVDFAVWSLFDSIEGSATQNIPTRGIPLCGLLDGEPDAVVLEAVGLARRGYRTLKVKVGRGEVGRDAEVVKRVASATGDGVRLRLDANRAWSMAEAMEFASLIEPASRRIEFIEEPLARAEPDALGMLSQESGMPVALDETLAQGRATIVDDGRYDFARAFVLKPQIIGATKSLGLARRASVTGASIVVSASYESGVGMLALIRFAERCAADEPTAAGLDTYRRLEEDVLETRLDLSGPVFEPQAKPTPRLRYDALERLL
ncbi:MAG: o-succinylbenzoate synthase [Rubrobacter sp.]